MRSGPKLGFKHSEETKRKIGLANSIRKHKQSEGYQKGHGDFGTRESHQRQGEKISGTRNWQWKGDRVGYRCLHLWVQRKLGKASKCENPTCIYPRKNAHGKLMLKPKRYHWANKSHQYKRNLTDWISLCVSCHWEYDRS